MDKIFVYIGKIGKFPTQCKTETIMMNNNKR